MKNAIVKTVVVCTMALALLFVGVATTNAVDTGVAVCHDGPYDLDVVY